MTMTWLLKWHERARCCPAFLRLLAQLGPVLSSKTDHVSHTLLQVAAHYTPNYGDETVGALRYARCAMQIEARTMSR